MNTPDDVEQCPQEKRDMTYLVIKLWPYLVLAFLIGIAISWITCRWQDDDQAS